MHTYRYDKDKLLWEVGHYRQITVAGTGGWMPMITFDSEQKAAAYVNYLNGGSGDFFPLDKP